MIRFAVMGCGRIGRMHAANLARHTRAELALVYDPAGDASRKVAAATGADIAQDPGEVMEAKNIQAILIASSTDTHLDLLGRALDAGKAVFCEKPIDLDLAKANQFRQRLQGGKATIMMGFNRRFDPSFKAMRQRIEAGDIGKLEQVLITSRDLGPPPIDYIKVSGGLFRDMTIHDFDMARFLAGDIASVQAIGANQVDESIQQIGDIDAAMITLIAKNGALCHINNSRRAVYGYDQRIEVFGADGMLQAGNHRPTTLSFSGRAMTGAKEPMLPFFIERYRDAYLAELDHFIECIETGKVPGVVYDDGLEAQRLAELAYESMKSGRRIDLV